MADNHEHGKMDTKEHEKTFDAFVTWSTRVAIVAVCILLFMALVNS
ncbi:aa3-type cytochrome c oxidase subunit IV [Roseovarius nanhaiticus]|uniref:Aa3 type cytochrome c oxidase subunit IV n=1 Tax=Roseovarius nanhaiticus TaxID=573024 RepID=A0A1N7HK08_9RHOB|nr:aa3-type cytochrome c oxidase subunit IV [Roseovarius nanhaiticus]SEL24465.1 aa3 type cytochrome c oxidase subunit IV [Roseovarius nanhaiticus]SIS25199.1 aa3 type cytochrome c oxidase subunit IV [Roseovarius nanhaiticus]